MENITTSCACLDKSGLKIISHLYVQSDIFLVFYLTDHPTYWDHGQLKTMMSHLQRV